MGKLILMVLSLMVVTSCAYFGKSYTPLGENEIWNSNEYGLIIGACSELDERELHKGSYTCRFEMDGGKHAISISAFSEGIVEFNTEKHKRRLFLIQVPAGEWYFSEWGVYIANRWIYYKIKKGYENLATISIKKGEAVYVGDIQLNIKYGTHALPSVHYLDEERETVDYVPVAVGAVPVIKNMSKVDLKLLGKKYKFLKDTEVETKFIDILKY